LVRDWKKGEVLIKDNVKGMVIRESGNRSKVEKMVVRDKKESIFRQLVVKFKMNKRRKKNHQKLNQCKKKLLRSIKACHFRVRK
jgi:hypothetical protein